jgi:oxygen-dependent protoporphyrinogen oxidase
VLAEQHRSLLLGGRSARAAAPTTDEPIFATPRAGMGALVAAAADDIRARGGAIHTDRPASSIDAGESGWIVDDAAFDAVVLAAPAARSADLLATVAPDAARLLRAIEYADVTMVRLAVPGADWPDRLHGRSGYLVPKPDQRFVTAASFGSQKWAHWRPADGSQILRTSIGRDGLPVRHLDDDDVTNHTIADLNRHLDLDLQPTEISITRWNEAFPQYRPYHHDGVAAVEAALPPQLVVAGASYRGVGIPACIADGARAAARIKESTPAADGFLT